MLSTVILAASTIIVTNVFGDVLYGEYSKVFVPVGIALLLQDPGITVALTRYVSLSEKQGEQRRQSRTILTGLAFNLGTAVVLSSILYLFATPIAEAFLQQGELDYLLRIASFAVIGQALVNAANAVFIGLMKVRLQNITLIIYSIIKALTSSALVLLGFGLTGAMVSHVASYFIAGAVALIITLLYVRGGGGVAYPSMEALRELLTFGTPIYLSNLFGAVFPQLASSLMVLYVASEEIGNYGAALTFTVLIGFLISPIQITIYPLFSKLERGSSYLDHAYKNAVKFSSLVALPGSFALMGLAHPIISSIYRDKFPTAALYFALYLLNYVTIGVGNSCQPALLNSQGRTRINMWKNVLSLLVGAPLALVLIPRFGILGLIFSLIVSAYPSLIYGHWYIKREFGLTFDRASSIKIYVSSLVALVATVLVIYMIGMAPIIEFSIGALTFLATYLVMLKVTDALNKDDYVVFRSILGTTGPLSRPLIRLLDIYQSL